MGIRNYVARRLLNVTAGTAFKMITETGNGFAAWTGDVYDSDIVRPASVHSQKRLESSRRSMSEDIMEKWTLIQSHICGSC